MSSSYSIYSLPRDGALSAQQVLPIKRIWATSKDFEHHCKELKERFPEQGYNSKLQDKYVKIVEKLDKNELIKGNKKIPQ